MSWLHLQHWGNLSAVCCPAWLTTTTRDYAPLFLFENSYLVTRPGRHSRELTLGLMGQLSLEPSQWRGRAPRGKPDMVLVSSLGEPRISDSPIGSSIQISFSKLCQDPMVLHWHLQGCWTHSSCAEGERKLQSHQPPKIMSLFGI